MSDKKEKGTPPAEEKTVAFKFKGTYEESEEALTAAKEEKAVALEELQAFRKEHSIKKDEPPTDDKLLKGYTKRNDTYQKKKAAVENLTTWRKENKPKKEPKIRDTKYEYPAGATAGDKKKIRATARAAAKRAEKGEKEPKVKKEKTGKKGKEEEAPKSKGEKKAEKKAAKKAGGEKKAEKKED